MISEWGTGEIAPCFSIPTFTAGSLPHTQTGPCWSPAQPSPPGSPCRVPLREPLQQLCRCCVAGKPHSILHPVPDGHRRCKFRDRQGSERERQEKFIGKGRGDACHRETPTRHSLRLQFSKRNALLPRITLGHPSNPARTLSVTIALCPSCAFSPARGLQRQLLLLECLPAFPVRCPEGTPMYPSKSSSNAPSSRSLSLNAPSHSQSHSRMSSGATCLCCGLWAPGSLSALCSGQGASYPQSLAWTEASDKTCRNGRQEHLLTKPSVPSGKPDL